MDPKQWLRKNPDRVGAWVAVALGALVLYLGWNGASNTAYPAEQLPFIISGGIGGALLVALGATLLISADLRDEWRKLDRIERRLAPPAEDPTEDPASPAQPAADATEAPASPAPVAQDDTGELVAAGSAGGNGRGGTRRSRGTKVVAPRTQG